MKESQVEDEDVSQSNVRTTAVEREATSKLTGMIEYGPLFLCGFIPWIGVAVCLLRTVGLIGCCSPPNRATQP